MKGAVLGLLLTNVVLAAGLYVQQGRSELPLTSAASLNSEVDSKTATIALLVDVPEQSLVRYGQAPVAAAVLRDQTSSAALSETAQPGPSQSCVEAGPFSNRQMADSVVAAAAPYATLKIEARTQSLPSVYRVYLPQHVSREAASVRLEELRAALAGQQSDIETFLIPRGELANGIALGLFSEQRNALNVKEQVEALGFPVTMREEARQEEQFWISSQPVDSEEKKQELMSALAGLEPATQVLEKLCQTIAQDIHLP
jgi:hypothetical protein